jgi:AcrR family transcriptional regulator
MSITALRHAKQRHVERSSTWDGIRLDSANNGLTRERIISAAVAIADQDGLAAVSIRRVASKLDASAMALYHYVPSKRDLLNLMLDATYGEFELAPDSLTDWRASLHHFAWESRRCLERHPWVSLLRTNDTEYGPHCIRSLEALLTSLSRFGLDIRTAIRQIGALFFFVNGFMTAERDHLDTSRPKGTPRRAARQPVFSKAVLATGNFPKVAHFIEMRAELPDDQAFERALNWMLEGMASDIQPQVRPLNRARLEDGPPISKGRMK